MVRRSLDKAGNVGSIPTRTTKVLLWYSNQGECAGLLNRNEGGSIPPTTANIDL
jgi:hypothetical protein